MLANNPLIRCFGSFLVNKSRNNFINYERNETWQSLSENLLFYSKYGFYDIIIPFLETVHVLCTKEVVCAIDDKVCSFSDASFIFSSLGNYHRKMIQKYNRHRTIGTKSEKEAWERVLEDSDVIIEKNVWESYDQMLIRSIADSRNRNLGLWIPALYTNDVDREYFQRLSSGFFGALKDAIEEKRNNPSNALLVWAITRQLRKLLGEINIHYSCSWNLEARFFQTEIKDLQRLSGRRMKELWFCETASGDVSSHGQTRIKPYYDYDEEWVRTIEKVCSIYDTEFSAGKHDITDRILKHVPLLYQLIDQHKQAEEKLINILNRGAKIYTAGLLASCSIAVAKTKRDDIRNWICSFLNNTYSLHMKNSVIQSYLDLLDDTIVFFKQYFDKLRENIESLDDSEREYYFSSMQISKSKSHNLLNEESDMWMYEYLIKDDTLLESIQACKEKIMEADNPLISGDDYIKRTLEIFYAASSHIGNNVRIDAANLLRALDLENEDISLLEVFYNDDYYDAVWHDSLFERYKLLQSEMPSRKYTQRAMDTIQEFCYGDSLITRKILQSSEMISNNPVIYHDYNEDELNTQIRDFLRAALTDNGYEVCDQSLQGVGASGKTQGRPDIVIRRSGIPIAIYEALIDHGDPYRKTHIDKAIRRYNISGCKRIYIIEFSRKEYFMHYWDSVKTTLHDYPQIKVEEVDSGLNGVKICEGVFEWNGDGKGEFAFIGVNCCIPKI